MFEAPKSPKLKVTGTERRLCHVLQRRGVPFVPQRKVATTSGRAYTVDVFIPKKIVIEVGYVNDVDVQEYEDLKQTGYTVLHFRNKQVQNHIQGVMHTIKKAQLRDEATK